MNYKSHIVTGKLCAIAFHYITKDTFIPAHGTEYVLGAVVGAVLPDIDHPQAFIGFPVPLVKHRTITHSLFFCAIVSLLGVTLFSVPCFIGLLLGTVSHLLLDMIDPRGRGVALLAPMTYKRIGMHSFFKESR